MRTPLACPTALLSVLVLACGDDTTASGDSTGGPGGGPGGTTGPAATATTGDASPTTGGADHSASEAHTATTDATDATATVPAPETTGDLTTDTTLADTTTTDDTTTADDTTGGVLLGCEFIGPEVEATLIHVGDPPAPCGPLEFIGSNYENDMGPLYDLDGCPCDSDCFAPDPWTFTLEVPVEALPAAMPVCPRIVVERQMSKQGCELVGVTIYETQNDDWPLPWYVAGSLLGPPAAAAADLTLEQHSVEVCECDGCCNPPERYDLDFGLDGDQLTLAEDAQGQLGDPDDRHYAVFNYQSHYSGICDDSPAIDWVVSLQPAP